MIQVFTHVRVTFASGVVRTYDLATYLCLPRAAVLGSKATLLRRREAIEALAEERRQASSVVGVA